MMEIIALAGAVISGGKKLMENEAVAETVNDVFNWIGNKLGGLNFITDKLDKAMNDGIEKGEVDTIINMLEGQIKDNEDLQKELAEKLENVKKVADQQGVPMVTKTNTMNVTGNNNISLQDINSGGNISIGG